MKKIKETLKNDDGFTLMDILVGMAIFAIITPIFVSIMSNLVQLRDSSDALNSGTIASGAIYTIMRSDIKEASYIDIRNAAGESANSGVRLNTASSNGQCTSWLVKDSSLYRASSYNRIESLSNEGPWVKIGDYIEKSDASTPYFKKKNDYSIEYSFKSSRKSISTKISGSAYSSVSPTGSGDCFD